MAILRAVKKYLVEGVVALSPTGLIARTHDTTYMYGGSGAVSYPHIIRITSGFLVK